MYIIPNIEIELVFDISFNVSLFYKEDEFKLCHSLMSILCVKMKKIKKN